MVTVIIKSFNRPYYLDRCIQSSLDNIIGNFKIIVLDDGTPEKYLQKIQKKYPDIIIKLSTQANQKRIAIDENLKKGESINGFNIPTTLWKQEVEKASEYVLVIEDDVWFTNKINLDEVTRQMKSHNIALTKLGWLGNYSDDDFCNITPISESLDSAIPKSLFTANKFIMNLFMYNKLKFFTILYKFGLVDNQTKRKYWALNSILMGLYKKEYWLTIWQDAKGKVDEKQQLRNASAWFHKNKTAVFARTKNEVLKTTFKSSATGSYHEYGNNFDVNRMNYILNEAWLNDELNPMENYPNDFSDNCIIALLNKINHPNALSSEWAIWAEKFKEQYRNQGALVD